MKRVALRHVGGQDSRIALQTPEPQSPNQCTVNDMESIEGECTIMGTRTVNMIWKVFSSSSLLLSSPELSDKTICEP